MQSRRFLSGLLSSLILSVLACRRGEMIVEAKDVKFFVLKEESASDGVRFLRIEGLVFHSSLAVDKIQQTRNDGTLQIDVYLTPARKGLSGSFGLKVPLDGVENVLFGPSQSQIWPKQ